MRFVGSPSSAIDLTLLAKRTLSRFFGFFIGHSLVTTDQVPLGYDCWRGDWILVILWTSLQRSHFDAIRGLVPLWILWILCGTPFPEVESPWGSKNPKNPKNPKFDYLPRSPALQRGPKNPTNFVFHVRFW